MCVGEVLSRGLDAACERARAAHGRAVLPPGGGGAPRAGLAPVHLRLCGARRRSRATRCARAGRGARKGRVLSICIKSVLHCTFWAALQRVPSFPSHGWEVRNVPPRLLCERSVLPCAQVGGEFDATLADVWSFGQTCLRIWSKVPPRASGIGKKI